MSDKGDRVPAELRGAVTALAVAAAVGLWMMFTARTHHGWSMEWRSSVGVGLLTIAAALAIVDIGQSLAKGRLYARLVSASTAAVGIFVLAGSAASTTGPRLLRWELTVWEQGVLTEIGAGLVILAMFELAVGRWLERARQIDEAHVLALKAALTGWLAVDGLTLAESQAVAARFGDLRRVNITSSAVRAEAAVPVLATRPDEFKAVALDRMIAIESRQATIWARAQAALQPIGVTYELDNHQRSRLLLKAATLAREPTVMPWDVEVQLADFARLWSSGQLHLDA